MHHTERLKTGHFCVYTSGTEYWRYNGKSAYKNKRRIVNITALVIQTDYASFNNTVDVNDYDSEDYSVSIRTNRWCSRVFLWLVGRLLFPVILLFPTQLVVNGISTRIVMTERGGLR